MKKIIPIKRKDIAKYGKSGDTKDMVRTPFPFPLYLDGDPNLICRNFYGNKYIAPAVISAFTEILDIYGLQFIKDNNLDWYGGCYSHRKSRGSDIMSDHAWGLAVDIVPQLGKFKEPSMIPYHYIQAFLNRGFIWGGNWYTPDGMHMSAICNCI